MRPLIALAAAVLLAAPVRADDGTLADELFDSVMRTQSAGQSLIGAGDGELLRQALGEAARQIQEDRKAGLEPSADEAPPPDLELEALKSLDRLARAYSNKRRSALLGLVSSGFAGNVGVLEDALASDFRAYQLINFRAVPDKPEVSDDLASVQFRYELSLTDARGALTRYQGRQRWVFRLEDGMAMLYKVDTPLIFGSSMPSEENPTATSQGPSPTAGSTAPGCGDPVTGTLTSDDRVNGPRFRTGTVVDFGLADVYLDANRLRTANGIRVLGTGTLDSVKSVAGNFPSRLAAASVGTLYAVRTPQDRYAVIRIKSIEPAGVDAMGTPFPAKATFDYKFQPRGETCF